MLGVRTRGSPQVFTYMDRGVAAAYLLSSAAVMARVHLLRKPRSGKRRKDRHTGRDWRNLAARFDDPILLSLSLPSLPSSLFELVKPFIRR